MNRRPRILLEALQVRRNPTGVGTAILDLCRALSDRDHGCDFIVLAAWPDLFDFQPGNPRWSVIPCEGARGGALRKAWFLQREVPRLASRLEGDLLHSLQFLAPHRIGIPLVSTVYDLAWLEHPDTIETARRLYYRLVVPGSLARSSAILAASQATGDDLRRHYPDLDPRIMVTPLGVPGWVGGASRRQDEPPGGGSYLFVGALEPRKNLVRILDAYARILERRGAAGTPDLVLVGPPGWRDGPIRERIARLAETGKVQTPGYCQPSGMSRLFRDALALVFPSLYEGFGLPILEAMALGVPVLTANRGATAEVAGDAALLVDPLDTGAVAAAMERLADDPALRNSLIRAGAERVKAFDWARTAEQAVAAYRKVLGEQGVRF
jgi:alpha-1,3-rhamnosyl/mannosyltransferase